MVRTVREFSAAGPCLTLGELVRETPRFYVIKPRPNGYGEEPERRVGKRGGLVHCEPCRCCLDHPETQYPDGYLD
jgi:hypothetical protein